MKLHLGCGRRIERGWINVDSHFDIEAPDGAAHMCCDIMELMPNIGSHSIDMIYTEHFIEHLTLDQSRQLLSECWRVLKKGSPIRISTPDLETVVNIYVAARKYRDPDKAGSAEMMAWHKRGTKEWPDPLKYWLPVGWDPESPAQMINGALTEWGHRFCWDWGELSFELGHVGFDAVRRAAHGKSDFDGMLVEARPDLGDLIVEAVAR
jgi:SAM-dependent methyltransferase